MDETDNKLLRILSEDSSLTGTEIGNIINLSIPAVNKRIAKLKEAGIIKKFTIETDHKKIYKPIQAFILLVIDRYSHLEDLLDFVISKKDIVECYAISGEYDYLIKIYSKDIENLESMLLSLKEKRCVAKSHTIFMLQEHKKLPCPLPD